MPRLIMFGKFVDDKEDGIHLSDIYFGGLVETEEEEQELAKTCIKNTKNGTIIPKVEMVNGDFMQKVAEAKDKFYVLESKMVLTEMILEHNKTLD